MASRIYNVWRFSFAAAKRDVKIRVRSISITSRPSNLQELPAALHATTLDSRSIPLIDLDAPNSANDICAACQSVGFLNIANHGVPESVISDAEDATRALFAMTKQQKQRLPPLGSALVHPSTSRGYSALSGETLDPRAPPDFKEFYELGLERELPAEPTSSPFKGPNPWPDEDILPSALFREPMLSYMEALHDLSLRILDKMAIGLNLPEGPDAFRKHFQDPVILQRLIHYPPQRVQDMAQLNDRYELGCGAHTDYGALTVLRQMDEPGLQVRHPHSESWVWVPVVPGTFTINIGDCLQHWTAGLFQSTLHRVANVNADERHSMAFFFDPDFSAIVDPSILHGHRCPGYDAFPAGQHKLAKYEVVWQEGYQAQHESIGSVPLFKE